MKEVLQLTFLTSLNKQMHMQVPNPKLPIDQAAVNKAMDAIVSGNIFNYPNGRIVKKVQAKVTSSDASIVTLQ